MMLCFALIIAAINSQLTFYIITVIYNTRQRHESWKGEREKEGRKRERGVGIWRGRKREGREIEKRKMAIDREGDVSDITDRDRETERLEESWRRGKTKRE